MLKGNLVSNEYAELDALDQGASVLGIRLVLDTKKGVLDS
jgi:hypothetical protein